jgi:hypothetical protein
MVTSPSPLLVGRAILADRQASMYRELFPRAQNRLCAPFPQPASHPRTSFGRGRHRVIQHVEHAGEDFGGRDCEAKVNRIG